MCIPAKQRAMWKQTNEYDRCDDFDGIYMKKAKSIIIPSYNVIL